MTKSILFLNYTIVISKSDDHWTHQGKKKSFGFHKVHHYTLLGFILGPFYLTLFHTPNFRWLDINTLTTYPIDHSVLDPQGNPVPPIDCIKVKVNTIIKIYYNQTRDSQHLTIGGRALKHDHFYGLYSDQDFQTEDYKLTGKFKVQ